MPFLRNLAAAGLAASIVAPSAAIAWTIDPQNAIAIDTAAVPGVAELSGLAYRGSLGSSAHEFLAVQDSGGQLVTLSVNLSSDGSLLAASATASRSLSPAFDFEGVALGPPGSVLVAEETTPAVRRYDAASGAATATLAMPAVFANDRPNNALESLSRAADGHTYWTANEEALTPDGPKSSTTQGTTVRLQQFLYTATGELTLGPQYAYEVDPIHVGTTTDARTRSGLSDLVALPDGSLLALERSLGISQLIFNIPLYQYESRIYRVTFDGATDTSQAPYSVGLAGQAFIAATKTLLWSGQAGGLGGENLEGLALGPLLPNGDYALLGVVDDGGGSDLLSGNTLVSFALSPPLAGDFNFDSTVDAADYVAWRHGRGNTDQRDHYSLWAGNYGATAAAPLPANVPEPAVWRLLLAVGLLPRRKR